MSIPYNDVANHARDSIVAVLFDADLRGKTGWEKRSPEYHLMHARAHLAKYMMGDTTDNHLENAQTRIAMARVLIRNSESSETQKRLPSDEFTAGGLDA